MSKRIFLATVIFVFSSGDVLSKEAPDSFQQVMNYLFTGNPLNDSTPAHGYSPTFPELVFKAKIFDRKKCVAGIDIKGMAKIDKKGGGFLKIYWNNIDEKSISVGNKFVKGEWVKFISFSGHPFVIDFQPLNFFYWIGRSETLNEGRSPKATILLGKSQSYDNDRMIRALRLLYSKHCTGQKNKSAF